MGICVWREDIGGHGLGRKFCYLFVVSQDVMRAFLCRFLLRERH